MVIYHALKCPHANERVDELVVQHGQRKNQ